MVANLVSVTKVIWLLWLQGWKHAPEIAQASQESWSNRNPGWKVWLLDRDSLAAFVPSDRLNKIFSSSIPLEALSDLIRLELLHRYGGVWADATTICSKPLDSWLNQFTEEGFFAFDRPGEGRMISTWFLAAHRGSYIIERWREAAADYWHDRAEREEYFWVHRLFEEIHETDVYFKSIWSRVPKISAVHQFHFGPDSPLLYASPSPAHNDGLVSPPVGVFKLTHKLSKLTSDGSLMSAIIAFAKQKQVAKRPLLFRRVLVAWYGSFGHGTIGDLRSMESVVTHMHALGHQVSHATDLDVEIPGIQRVDWRTVDPLLFDCVVFVCGPIIRSHIESNMLFSHFSSSRMAGVGVSLFSPDSPSYCNPFKAVFARQGADKDYGDVAIVAPKSLEMGRLPRKRNPRIGIVLRGKQVEYGVDLCQWAETEALVLRTAWAATKDAQGEIKVIENHLVRSTESPDAIEAHYAECDLILTSRFHGAIESLRSGVPFIAIDQIKGGQKS